MFNFLRKIVNLNFRLINAAAGGMLNDFSPQTTTIRGRLNYLETKWLSEAYDAARSGNPVVVTVLLNDRPTKIYLNRINEVTGFGRVIGEQAGNKQTIHFNSWQILAIDREPEKKESAKPKEDAKRAAEA